MTDTRDQSERDDVWDEEDVEEPTPEPPPFTGRPLEEFDAPGEDALFRTGGQNEGPRVNEGDAQGPS